MQTIEELKNLKVEDDVFVRTETWLKEIEGEGTRTPVTAAHMFACYAGILIFAELEGFLAEPNGLTDEKADQ